MRDILHVHQFTPSISAGDGVSQGVFFTQEILRELGYFTLIYSNHIDDSLKGKVLHIDEYQSSDRNILLYHHCIGHDHHEKIMCYPDKKVLVYHNITPSHFFTDAPHLQHACDWGREQLVSGFPHVLASYADSEYNADELKSVGYLTPEVIPILVDVEECLKKGAAARSDILDRSDFNILFVGRLVSNKNQHQLIDVLYAIKNLCVGRSVKLHLIGGTSEPEYVEFIQSQIRVLNLESFVEVVGKVSDKRLYDYMKSSDLFLCLSEHEGFCMPIIEAICSDLPVLAYKAGGIPTTLGPVGLFDFKSSTAVADMVARYIVNPELLNSLAISQKENLNRFSKDGLKKQLSRFLEKIPG